MTGLRLDRKDEECRIVLSGAEDPGARWIREKYDGALEDAMDAALG